MSLDKRCDLADELKLHAVKQGTDGSGKCGRKRRLQAHMIAGFTRGTQQKPLPLLPSGPGGVHGVPLREARLSYAPANIRSCIWAFTVSIMKKMAEREGFEPSVRY